MTDDDGVTREELHFRRIDMRGWKRSDGLFEIEGRVTDTKPHDFKAPNGPKWIKAGDALHDMGVRLVFDEDMVVREAVAFMNAAPYDVCYGAPGALASLKGLRMAGGWTGEVRKRLGGAQGCSHLMEMLTPMAAAAYQSLTVHRTKKPLAVDADGRPLKINSCYAYGQDRAVVLRNWPKFYTGPEVDAPTAAGMKGEATSG